MTKFYLKVILFFILLPFALAWYSIVQGVPDTYKELLHVTDDIKKEYKKALTIHKK